MSVTSGVRERRRAETIREIKTAALDQVEAVGAAGISLRAIAGTIGMTVQSLYHYFDSRDALLTALLIDGHNDLADHLISIAEATADLSPIDRRLATTSAFRDWALANRALFLTMFGTPVPGFGPDHEDIDPAVPRIAAPFVESVFAGWTSAELAALPLPEGGAPLESVSHPDLPLPPGAAALFIELRGRMHGLVMLEIVGALQPFNDHGDVLFEIAMRRMSADLDRLQSAVQV